MTPYKLTDSYEPCLSETEIKTMHRLVRRDRAWHRRFVRILRLTFRST
jgi:hypothetical protein